MAREILFKVHDKAFVRVGVLKRRRPKSKDLGIVNLLDASLEAVVGEFRLDLEMSLTTHEIVRFHTRLRRLYDVLEGGAVLCVRPYEIRVTGDGLGHMAVECGTCDESETNRMAVRLAMDQTYLPPVLRQLGAAALKFPVKGRPSEAGFNAAYSRDKINPGLVEPFYRIYREVARRPADLKELRVVLKRFLFQMKAPEARTLENLCQAMVFFQGHTERWESDWTHLPAEYQAVFDDFENALLVAMNAEHAAEDAPGLEDLLARVQALKITDWEPYDPYWLVQMAKEQLPGERWLPAALSKCTICRRKGETRIEFINGNGLKRNGVEPSSNANLTLSLPSGEELKLSVHSRTISGIEIPAAQDGDTEQVHVPPATMKP